MANTEKIFTMTESATKPTRSKSQRRRAVRSSPEKRKRELQEFGVKAFAAKGIGNANHADVAKVAHVSVATVFTYFPNKKALVDGILAEVARMMREQVVAPGQEVLAYSGKSASREMALTMSARAVIQGAHDHPEYTKVWLMWGVLYDPEMRTAYLEVESEFDELALALLKTLDDAKEADPQTLADRARLMTSGGTTLMKLALDEPSTVRCEVYMRHIMGAMFTPFT
ncbi:MAG: TetR/AcrR family transcriptional regulator [Halioglobus sp.]